MGLHANDQKGRAVTERLYGLLYLYHKVGNKKGVWSVYDVLVHLTVYTRWMQVQEL